MCYEDEKQSTITEKRLTKTSLSEILAYLPSSIIRIIVFLFLSELIFPIQKLNAYQKAI